MAKKILILGVNGFIGHHLSKKILERTDWEIYGMDMNSDRVQTELKHDRFHFFEGDITINKEWVEYHIKKCDVIIPLVAIATPSVYITDPLRTFELDFEANLPIVRSAVKYGKRLVFPSTSEVYGMSTDEHFDPERTSLVYGPISKTRWIYAASKQLMDRVIHAYGQQHGLRFTLFRPFNWIGPGLDSIHATTEGSSRVVALFLGQIIRGENIHLVGGGEQRRSFTYVSDGIEALLKIIENPNNIADSKIYNIGNPANDFSIRELATMMLGIARQHSAYAARAALVQLRDVDPESFYGTGYQDTARRVPAIDTTCRDLEWAPQVPMSDALRQIFDAAEAEAQQHSI